MLKSYHTEDLVEAGVDEAGRGCLAGPVVAASVILPKDYHHPILNDSKQLSKKQRELLREEIKRDAISWAIAEVSHTVIDEINILNASFLAMHKAIGKLKTKPELLLIDGNRFKPYKKTNHHCIVEGDAKYLSIAAASVLAKTYRDDLMVKLASKFPVYDWENNMGYGTPKHREAIFQNGLSPFHRLSFKIDKSGSYSQLNLF
ncbi:MAG: ribonuclease HII [Sporocytophaga sp.]|nr:ribonuclease HII [Sporocytophaga sp.]